MKASLFAFVFSSLMAASALAAQKTSFKCQPSAVNGHKIETLSVNVSLEDVAKVGISYGAAGFAEGFMSYSHFEGQGYELKNSVMKIVLNKIDSKIWEAQVTSKWASPSLLYCN